MIAFRIVPYDLRDAYSWTKAAGEIETLAALTGDALHEYAYESVQNAGEHGVRGIYMGDLHDLSAWLKQR